MEESKACMQTALRSLTRKMSSEKEMIEKLQKKDYSLESIDATMNKLKQLRYLDDAKLIEALCEPCLLTTIQKGTMNMPSTGVKKGCSD